MSRYGRMYNLLLYEKKKEIDRRAIIAIILIKLKFDPITKISESRDRQIGSRIILFASKCQNAIKDNRIPTPEPDMFKK